MMLSRRMLTTMAMIVIASMFVGCDKDEEVPDLYGTWLLTAETKYYGESVTVYDSSKVTDLDGIVTILVFGPDDTSTFTTMGTTLDFTYTQSASEITLDIELDLGRLKSVLDYTRVGDELTTTAHYLAEDTDPEYWVVSVYMKQSPLT